MEQYKKEYPDTVLVDQIEKVANVINRVTTLEVGVREGVRVVANFGSGSEGGCQSGGRSNHDSVQSCSRQCDSINCLIYP